MDLTVKLDGYIYVMEIKVQRGRKSGQTSAMPVFGAQPDEPSSSAPDRVQPAEISTDDSALAQIRAHGYSDKYRGLPSQGLFELGLVFDSQARNLVQADWRRVT